jgi:hypothetical protein
MPNPAGNTSSSKQGYKNLRGTSQKDADSKALRSMEIFGAANPMIDAAGAEQEAADVNYAFPINGKLAEGDSNPSSQGNGSMKMVNPGPGVTRSRYCAGSKDPTPGGGW